MGKKSDIKKNMLTEMSDAEFLSCFIFHSWTANEPRILRE